MGFFNKLPSLLSSILLISTFVTSVFGYFPITGAGNGVHARREIRTLVFDYTRQWNLYVQAIKALQAEDQNSVTSWYQILGIHGVPVQAWDGVGRQSTGGGYCVHSSNMFPTWHRPYVALFEQRVVYHAKMIAKKYKGKDKKAWQHAASTLRVPYYDWAEAPASGRPAMPQVITEETVVIQTPSGVKSMANPLFKYVFHPFPSSDFAAPWNTWTSTRRWPASTASNAPSQNNLAAATMAKNRGNFAASLYQFFTNCPNWLEISNDEQSNSSPGCQVSLEGIHNNVHVQLGGTVKGQQGHMTIIPYSAFDPVFMLHHVNIDRMLALWQAVHPNSFVPPQASKVNTFILKQGVTYDENTPLYPFHGKNNQWWTSKKVRDHKVFGYTYPEMQDGGGSKKNVMKHINRLYGPNASKRAPSSKRDLLGLGGLPKQLSPFAAPLTSSNGSSYQYIANIASTRYGLEQSYSIFLFNGDPVDEDPSTWSYADNLLGMTSIFSQAGMADAGIVSVNSIPLTDALSSKVANGLLTTLEEALVVPYLTQNLKWRVAGATGVIDPSDVPDLNIAIYASSLSQYADDTFPTWGDFVPLTSITHGKAGGALNRF